MRNVWRAWAVALIGGWFFVSAWLFDTQVDEFTVFGGLMLLIGLWIASDEPGGQLWRAWLLAAMSGWMAVMPWVVPFGPDPLAAYTTLALGLIGAVVSIRMVLAAQRN
ncbi:MAG TPA: hypothetical protein VNM16_02185 [Bacillota bacterium]|nr:hypothetical protein [Bacillota bacterium]